MAACIHVGSFVCQYLNELGTFTLISPFNSIMQEVSVHDVGPFREEEMHYSNVARSDGIAENGLVQVWTVVDICSAVDEPFHEFYIVDGVATVEFSLVSK